MAKWEEVPISEARASLGELASQVYYRGGTIMLTKNGKAIAAIVPVAVAERTESDREKLKEAVAQIRALNLQGDMTQEEWDEFVLSEVDAVRTERLERETKQQLKDLEPAL